MQHELPGAEQQRVGAALVTVYTIPEVAALLKMGERTVKRHISTGQLQSTKLGRLRRITQEQVDEFVRRGRGV